MIYPATVEGLEKEIYPNADAIQVEDLIKQAIVETSRIELKQGLLSLSSKKREQAIDPTLTKILKTAVAIGNTARMYDGAILIGVADSDSDSERAERIDRISPQPILNRSVVGVDREWRYLNISEEDYIHRIRDFILNSPLSYPLKEQLVNEIHLVKIRDLHVVYIRIPGQDTPSKYDDSFYVREGDQTIMVQDDDYARIGRLMTSFG